MWVFGLIVFYIFYRIGIVYYIGMFTKASLQRPMASIYSWFHPTIISISVGLLLLSGFFFYLSNPWLAIIPLPLAIICLLIFGMKLNSRRDKIIDRAVDIQVQLERKDLPQGEINKAIYLATTGEMLSIDTDMDFKSFMKYFVLRQTVGFDASADLQQKIEHMDKAKYTSLGDQIEATIDTAYAKQVKARDLYDRISQKN
jgi:hypothetical protein